MWYQIFSYLKFLFNAKNQHGVHSPFVYDLVTNCFYDKKKHSSYSKIKSYLDELQQDDTQLLVKDFGSGSRVFNSEIRKVSDIARTSGSSIKNAKFLFRLLNYFQPKKILELGTSLGISTYAMLLGNTNSEITSIEGSDAVFNFTKSKFQDLKLENVTLLQGKFNETLHNLEEDAWDLVFFDGNHKKQSTLDYFETVLNNSHENSIFIFDDIYWSNGMTEAWESIKNHPKVTVSIDTFFYGIVAFRKGQVKEHFKIRL